MTDSTPQESPAWTIGRLLTWTTEYLGRNGVDEARLATEMLLAHSGGCRRIDLYTRFEKTLQQDQLKRFRHLVTRAARHEPIAYLVGEKEFFSLPFRVSPDVLIPRPETETLVEAVLDHFARAKIAAPRFLDLGTGSGCIAITLLSQAKQATAVAVDTSESALGVARENADRHHVSDRITFLRADRLDLPAGAVPEHGFDVLVSNPPYLSAGETDRLAETIQAFEPRVALTDGEDGLSFYRTIEAKGHALLAPNGVVALEIGDGQAPAVRDILSGRGRFTIAVSRKDRTVGHERVLLFRKT